MTQRSEDEVCLVLYQCDYDMNQAVELLIEGGGTVSKFSFETDFHENLHNSTYIMTKVTFAYVFGM